MAVPQRTLVGAGLVLALIGSFPSATSAATDGSTSRDATSRLMATEHSGTAAISALGADLGTAADRSGMSAARLSAILSSDPTATVGRTGRLTFRDQRAPRSPYRTGATPAFPTSQTFTLHSRPSSTRKMFLDFNGATVSGTYWNLDAAATIPARTYSGFSLDSDFARFSTDEHAYIQEVWRETAEAYATFDVDITTQDPGAAGYNRSSPSDASYGDHVVFSEDPASDPVCDSADGCAGIALVGTFGETDTTGYDEPAWIRYRYSNGAPANTFDTAMTAAHEIGHTLGLSHDGVSGPGATDYYSGQGDWSPIMGSGINAVQQFSNGDYANATNTEDDFAEMVAHGLPRLADDAGNTVGTAKKLGAQPTFVVPGRIGSRSDTDYYLVGPCTAAPTVSATNTGQGSALDLKLELRTAGDALLATSNPPSDQVIDDPNVATGMSAPGIRAAGPGTYAIKLDGVGNGNPLTTGYSDYGSVGSYRLTITGCGVSRPAAPTIGRASSGAKKRPVTATARWTAAGNGGAAITSYRVFAAKLNSAGQIARTITSKPLGASARSYVFQLPAGKYRFRVVASNAKGTSAPSGYSGVITAR